jgi:hypothetical protein
LTAAGAVGGLDMFDVLFIAIGLAFFALAALYAVACDRF